MNAPAPANDYASPGEDFYVALALADPTILADDLQGLPWRGLPPQVREAFERAALTFLAEP